MMASALAACGLAPIRDGSRSEEITGDFASRAADNAAAMVGRPYRFGGESPTTGFDCSGLVQYSFRRAGLKVPRQTDEQSRYGRRVDASDLRRGDLVFFNQDGKLASHVGVYLGHGRFVHAPSSGKHVRIDSLDSAYWRRSVADFRRFAN